MTATLALIGSGVLVGLVFLVREICRAPIGYQDDSGFHFGHIRPRHTVGRAVNRRNHAEAA